MQEGYYCGCSRAGGTEGVLVSKTSRKRCGVEDWVQVTTNDKLFKSRGEWWEDRDRTEVSWLRGLGNLGDRCNEGSFPLGRNDGLNY